MDAYVFLADLLCGACGLTMVNACKASEIEDTGDSGDFPQGPYADGGGESDSPQHCRECSLFLENPLTGDGVEYVKASVTNNGGQSPVVAQWCAFYGIEARGDENTPQDVGEPDPDTAVAEYRTEDLGLAEEVAGRLVKQAKLFWCDKRGAQWVFTIHNER